MFSSVIHVALRYCKYVVVFWRCVELFAYLVLLGTMTCLQDNLVIIE